MKTDAELQKAVDDELLFEPSVTATDIGITVKKGVVALVGTVKSYAEKWAAERAAERVSGVRALVKDLRVALPSDWRRTDQDIAAAALDALKWDVQVPEGRVRVEVEEGYVTLTGDVDWNFQREAAEHDVRRLTGVVNVSNLIAIVPSVSAGEVRSKIESALQRAACKDARRITVQAQGDVVTLSGEVHSWAEREDVERAAWNAPGVQYVDDRIRVQP
jgi:osmotically-inducible protein OsmY